MLTDLGCLISTIHQFVPLLIHRHQSSGASTISHWAEGRKTPWTAKLLIEDIKRLLESICENKRTNVSKVIRGPYTQCGSLKY